MKTLRLLSLLVSLSLATLALAEPAKPARGTTPPPPAAVTTSRPGQPAAAPVSRGGMRSTPFGGRTTAPGAAQPAGRNSGPAPTTSAPRPGAQPPVAQTRPAPQLPRRDSVGAPPNPGPARGNEDPRPDVRGNEGRRPDVHGNQDRRPAPQERDQRQPNFRDKNDRRPEPRRDGPALWDVKRAPAPPRHEEWDRPYRGRYEGHWKYAPLVGILLRAFLPSNPRVLGAAIVGADDTFLGVISRDPDDADSIANSWGRFGSPYSPASIWNPEGRWGSRYAPNSPWNPDATRPPRVFDGDEFRGYLTTNRDYSPRIDPEWLRDYLDLPRW